MLGIGLPMGLQFSITAIGSVVVQWSVNGLGVNAVAAVSAAVKLSMFFCCVFDALASTMATFAGQNIGARKLDRVREGMRAASAAGIIYCVLALGVALLFGDKALGLFIDSGENAAVMELAFRFLKINAAFYIPLLFVNILRLCIQGMGYTRVASLLRQPRGLGHGGHLPVPLLFPPDAVPPRTAAAEPGGRRSGTGQGDPAAGNGVINEY